MRVSSNLVCKSTWICTVWLNYSHQDSWVEQIQETLNDIRQQYAVVLITTVSNIALAIFLQAGMLLLLQVGRSFSKWCIWPLEGIFNTQTGKEFRQAILVGKILLLKHLSISVVVNQCIVTSSRLDERQQNRLN